MKTITVRLFAIFLIIASFSACSGNDDAAIEPSVSAAALIGKWTELKIVESTPGNPDVTTIYQPIAGCNRNYTEFMVNNTAKDVYYEKPDNICIEDIEMSTWTLTGNILRLNMAGDIFEAVVESMSATQMVIMHTEVDMGVTYTSRITLNKLP